MYVVYVVQGTALSALYRLTLLSLQQLQKVENIIPSFHRGDGDTERLSKLSKAPWLVRD
jgi:hypothetical protein